MPNQIPDAAVQKLSVEVHDPVFFDKLAEWNIHPRTQEERDNLLEMASLLREAKDQESVKYASASNDFLTGALGDLRTALGIQGYSSGPPVAEVAAIKQAAARAIENPELARAALEYGAYLASQQ